ncbi:Eukaryotic translation initiation factor 2D [Rhizoctonia solani]|uniref:Eukaryotic translation initiation factor 2D n=1 Tax=Rhizoctonia solani TaxID=456999 RepID=A0A0K6G4B9_9AGAM|nr:Eukaryotic translation initiation factor 2D [Rhizoctonia solani]
MFKKPLHKTFTSSALRNSDVKLLRQRVLVLFPDSKDKVDIEVLVPKGITSCKFDTHLDETGTLYSSAEKEPLWFSMGKGGGVAQSNLIPTVYTLWKFPTLLPTISTPAAVIPILVGGADLMIPGVVPSPILPSLTRGQLVSVTQYRSTTPLVVGSMAINGSELKDDADQKGKAVVTLHAAGDVLWALGSKQEPPEGRQPETDPAPVADIVDGVAAAVEDVKLDGEAEGEAVGGATTPERIPTAQELPEIEATLWATTLYALARLDAASLPLPASTFYSSHILPSRPARPTLPSSNEAEDPIDPKVFLSHLDIKHTPHKKLASFLKTFEKDGILKLKDVRGELLVFSVDAKHPALVDAGKWGWKTIGDAEKKGKERERNDATDGSVKEILIEEVWFPEARTESFFEACGESAPHYALSSLRSLLAKYITTHNLQHPTIPKFVVLDDVLSRALLRKGEDEKEFVGRDELVERLSGNMKGMWRVGGAGGFKKMPLQPVNVQTKARQGRKVVTLITGFESFGIDPELLSDELRKRCASSTSVTPCVEKPKQLEVMVQGNQTKAVAALLLELGLPKKWVKVSESTGKGKGGK